MSFFKAIATVGGLTLGSRLMGFLRDVMTASFVGAGPVADAFFIALKLPNFFRRITAEGAFSVSFVPMFSKVLAEEGPAEARRFAEEAQAVMVAVLLPFTVICMIAMPWVLYVIAPGVHSDPTRLSLAVDFTRITFPYILMMSLTALLGGVLNSFGKFAAFAAAPIFFNLMLIIALLFGSKIFATGGHALAWGLAAAGVAQFAWMFYNYWSIGYVLRARKPKLTPRIRKLFRLMVPGTLGAGAAQINLFVDMILASLLPVGSISFLYYADRLYQLPLGVIGVAIGTALLPMLSTALKTDMGEAKKLLGQGVEAGLLLSLPATCGLIVLAEPIMDVLFAHGQFSHENAMSSAHAMIAYAVGLPAYVLARVFSTASFAREDTATPVKFAVICAVINTLLALALIKPLQHVGIALATGLTAWINLALLFRALHKRRHIDLPKASLKRAAKIIVASAFMTGVVWILKDKAWSIPGLAVVVGLGGIVYFAALFAFGIRMDFPTRKKKAKIEPKEIQDA